MNLNLRIKNAEMHELLRRHIERRLRFALGRFGDRVGQVSTTVHGAEGRSGESRFQIRVEILPFGSFAIEERGQDLFSAIDRAAGRIGHRIGRELDRERQTRMTRESIRMQAA
jgi:putative sigma-54 modulation protein